MTVNREAEHACAALIAAFPYFIDNGDYDGVVSLFAEDGQFQRPGVDARGHGELRVMLEARPADIATRHVCGPPLFLSVGDNAAQAVTYFTLFQCERGDDLFPRFEGPSAVAEYHDTFIRAHGEWKISARRVKVGMVGKNT